MKRREFIASIGSAAAAWPLAARAQRTDRTRRIGVLLGWSENDPVIRAYFAAAVQHLAQLGWVEGRNIEIDVRWTGGNVDQSRVFAKELVAWQPNVIFTGTTPATAAVQNATSTIPIIFVVVADPVGAGFVNSLPQPGGNITGFINIEAAMGGKWADLLKEIAPDLSRLAIMFNPETAPYSARFLPSFDAAAQSLGVETIRAPVRSKDEIETSIASLGPRTGLVVMTDSFLAVHRGIIISLVATNRVPAIFESALFCRAGGLISYGPDYPDLWRRAAMYIDRVLRGTKPNDLPVEVPIKFELAINASTARALGLAIPNTLLTIADEVIE
jgi:putative tryptophan/tyrosine transport system substrate-binding protein